MQPTTSQVTFSEFNIYIYGSGIAWIVINPNCRYEAVYAKDIPEVISGEAFSEKYGDHNDTVTVIDPKRSYSVKASTRHPIYENFRVEVKSLDQIICFYTTKSIF